MVFQVLLEHIVATKERFVCRVQQAMPMFNVQESILNDLQKPSA